MIRSQSRSVGGLSPGWFYFLSFLFHLCIILVLFFLHDHRPKGFPSATTVTLVTQEEVKKLPTPPVPQKPKRVIKKTEAEKNIPKKIPVHRNALVHVRTKPVPVVHKVLPKKSKKIVPQKRVRPHKQASKPVKAKPVKNVRKSASPKVPNKVVPTKSRVVNQKPNPVKMDIQGQAFPSYLEHLLISKIKSNWFPPPGSHGLRATVRFVLLKNGHIKGDPEVITGSGATLFDEAAKMAVLRSDPFPQMPPSFHKEEEVVTVTLEATSHGDVFNGN